MAHNFKRVKDRIYEKDKTKAIFRCDKCDSEAVFNKKYSDTDVNKLVGFKWPNFLCVKNIVNQ
jgi:formylmethanofuran dehydrogenase subunit E